MCDLLAAARKVQVERWVGVRRPGARAGACGSTGDATARRARRRLRRDVSNARISTAVRGAGLVVAVPRGRTARASRGSRSGRSLAGRSSSVGGGQRAAHVSYVRGSSGKRWLARHESWQAERWLGEIQIDGGRCYASCRVNRVKRRWEGQDGGSTALPKARKPGKPARKRPGSGRGPAHRERRAASSQVGRPFILIQPLRQRSAGGEYQGAASSGVELRSIFLFENSCRGTFCEKQLKNPSGRSVPEATNHPRHDDQTVETKEGQ